MGSHVAIYLCDPVSLEIKYKFRSMTRAARALGVSRQAVHVDMRKGHRVKGYMICTPETYKQLKG